MTSLFDPQHQQHTIDGRIAAALERIAEAFRVLLWAENKKHGLSPLQIQLLIFVLYHSPAQCTTTALAREFNMSKPTISDAVRILEEKGLVVREKHPEDARSTVVRLTDRGRQTAVETSGFAGAIEDSLAALPADRKAVLLTSLLDIIGHLQEAGVISTTRMCFSCRFFSAEHPGEPLYCTLMQRPLAPVELRVDCPDFAARR